MGEGMITDGASFTLTDQGASSPGPGGAAPSAGAAKSTSDAGATIVTSSRRSSHGTAAKWLSGRSPNPDRKFGSRTVLDSPLNDGHALWVADVDGDGDDEVFAGHRGKDQRVSSTTDPRPA